MQQQSQYSKEGLIRCGDGELFGPPHAQLPIDNMLMMFDSEVIYVAKDLRVGLF